MHPRQGELPPEIEDVWLAALEDADIDPDEALLYKLDGESGNGYGARCLYRGWRSTQTRSHRRSIRCSRR
jgi:hypothetical protein